jgi:hypothetical protein
MRSHKKKKSARRFKTILHQLKQWGEAMGWEQLYPFAFILDLELFVQFLDKLLIKMSALRQLLHT